MKGVKTTIAGVVLFVTGLVVSFVLPLLMLLPLVLGDSDDTRFLGPHSFQMTVEEPGRYYLWNYYQTVFEGKSYNQSASIPDGWTFRILNSETTEPYDFIPRSSISLDGFDGSASSIGYIDLKQPGPILIEVTGAGSQRVFSFGRSPMRHFPALIAATVVSGLVVLVGIVTIIIGVVKMIQSKKQKQA